MIHGMKKEEYKEGVLVSTFLDLVICKTIEGYSKNKIGYLVDLFQLTKKGSSF